MPPRWPCLASWPADGEGDGDGEGLSAQAIAAAPTAMVPAMTKGTTTRVVSLMPTIRPQFCENRLTEMSELCRGLLLGHPRVGRLHGLGGDVGNGGPLCGCGGIGRPPVLHH